MANAWVSKASSEYDFAVVGGGLVGMAIAWGLARRGRKRGRARRRRRRLSRRAGNFALVWVQSKGVGLPNMRSGPCNLAALAELAQTLKSETGLDVCFPRPGGLHLLLSEREVGNRANALKRLHNQPGMQGFDYEILDHDEVEKMLPQIGPDVVGASFCPADGHVQRAAPVARAASRFAAAAAAAIAPNHAVDAIEPRAGDFRLHTRRRRDRGAADRARRRARQCAPCAHGRPRGAGAPAARPDHGHGEGGAIHDHIVHTVRQTDEGSVMISDSVEEAGYDISVGSEVLSVMAQRAVRMLPLLARLNVVRCWAALRVMTKDGFPIYDQSRQPSRRVPCDLPQRRDARRQSRARAARR